MPLNWYISEVEDWDNYCFEPAPENPKDPIPQGKYVPIAPDWRAPHDMLLD